METGAAPKEPAARPVMASDSPIVKLLLRKGLRGAIELFRAAVSELLQAAARFRRLLGVLARQPGLVLTALLRAPGSFANLVRMLLSSRPARMLSAAAASLVCITLQYHRPKSANIHLSSSISLLFGMIKLQGSLALQLGPPDSRNGVEQPAGHQDELRINCSKDLKEHIVRFLESQAARNFAAASPAWQLSPHKEPQPQQQTMPPLPPLTEPAAAVDSCVGGACRNGGTEAPLAESAAPAPPYTPPTAAATTAPTAASGQHAAALAGTGAAAAAAAAVLPSLEALLPSTPPLGSSPPTSAAVLGGNTAAERSPSHSLLLMQPRPPPPPLPAPQQQSLAHNYAFLAALGPAADAPPALDPSDYLSLMSYAASYRPSMAVLDSPRAGMATHGSSAGFYDIPPPPTETESSAEEEAEPGAVGPAAGGTGGYAAAAPPPAATAATASGGVGVPLRKSRPDSVLGLRGMGLEGWVESSRRWESRYLENDEL